MNGNAVEVGRPFVVERLNSDSIVGTLLQFDWNHLPTHAIGVPGISTVTIALKDNSIAYLLAIDEELGGACIFGNEVYG